MSDKNSDSYKDKRQPETSPNDDAPEAEPNAPEETPESEAAAPPSASEAEGDGAALTGDPASARSKSESRPARSPEEQSSEEQSPEEQSPAGQSPDDESRAEPSPPGQAAADDGPAPAPASDHAEGSGSKGRGARVYLAAIAALALIAAVALVLLVTNGDGEGANPGAAVGELRALARSVDQSQSDLAALRAQVARIENRLQSGAAAGGGDGGGRERLEALEAAIARMESGADADKIAADVAPLKAQLDELSSQNARELNNIRTQIEEIASAAARDREALGARLEKLESADIAAAARRVSLALALADLSYDALNGRPFATELDIIESLGGDAAAIARLRPHAETGLATLAELSAEFRIAAIAALKAERNSQDGNWFVRLFRNLRDMVTVRRVGDVEGDSLEAVIARAELELDSGDVDGAVAEIRSLSGPAAEAFAEWREAAEARARLDALVRQLKAALARDLAG